MMGDLPIGPSLRKMDRRRIDQSEEIYFYRCLVADQLTWLNDPECEVWLNPHKHRTGRGETGCFATLFPSPFTTNERIIVGVQTGGIFSL